MDSGSQRTKGRGGWGVLALGLSMAAGAQTLSSSVISAGGGVSQGGCWTLESTLGEAAPGVSAGGVFRVTSGYYAGAGSAARDAVFHNGFQECAA